MSINLRRGLRPRRTLALLGAASVILAGAVMLASPAGATTVARGSSPSTSTGTAPTAIDALSYEPAPPDAPSDVQFVVSDTSTACTHGSGCQYPSGTVDVYVDGAFQQSIPLEGAAVSCSASPGASCGPCYSETTGDPFPGMSCATGSFTFTSPSQTVSYYYSGDSVFAPSSGSYTQQVNPAVTATALTQSSTSSDFGQPVTLTATVASDPNYAAPTGPLQFYDVSCPKQEGCPAIDYTVTPLGDPVPLNGGVATLTTSALPVGTNEPYASYIGGATWAPSRSATGAVVHTVAPGVTIVSLASSSPSGLAGHPVTYAATVIPAPGGGTVAFSDGGTGPIAGCGSQPVGADGTATCQVTYGVAGSHDIYAAYSGDANYLASSSLGAYTQVVQQATTVALDSSSPSVRTGQPLTYTATVNPNPGGGTVAFSDGGTPIAGCGSQPVSTGGAATCQTTYGAAGTHAIYAAFSGYGPYAPSPTTPGAGDPPPITQTVLPDNDLAISTPTNITTDATGPGGATVTYSPPSVSDEETPIPTPTCSPASGSTFPVGTTTVTCTATDPDDTPTTVASTFTVHVKGAQTITFTSTPPPGAAVGGTTTVTATGGASGNPVVFSIDPLSTSVCSISAAKVTFTAVGNCVIDANQAGNADYNVAAQATQTVTVKAAPTSVSPSPATVTLGLLSKSVHMSAAVTSKVTGAGIAGVRVTFSLGAGATCTATTDSRGGASCSVTYGLLQLLTPIPPTYTASFSGSTNYLASSATGTTKSNVLNL